MGFRMFEIKEIWRIRNVSKSRNLETYEVYNTESRAIICKVDSAFNAYAAQSAQTIADALNAKLAHQLTGVENDDPWKMPVPLDLNGG